MRCSLHSQAQAPTVNHFSAGVQRAFSTVSQGFRRPRRHTSLRRPAVRDGQPVLLFDVMDTVVWDPFYTEMPRFFGISLKELFALKHPTAWVEFESGMISEADLLEKFFHDGRSFDGEGLRQIMVDGYRFLEGMEPLLQELKDAGQPMHIVSNYPVWYEHIEAKLGLSRYLPWTFVSCTGPMQGLRKPAPGCFQVVAETLSKPPEQLILVDDRKPNIDAARAAGWDAIHFLDADMLRTELHGRGILP